MSQAASTMLPFLRRHGVSLLCIGALALLIVAPVVATGGWFRSHDGMRYPYLTHLFAEAIKAGISYPRWLPDLMKGYGYPTFVFYQPAYFYLSAFFTLFIGALNASYVTLWLIVFTGGAGAYALARRQLPPWLSCSAAALFMLTHYVAANIFERGDFSELFAMMLFPWAIVFGFRLVDAVRLGAQPYKAMALLIITLIGIATGHPLVAFLFFPFLLGLLLVYSRQGSRWNGEAVLLILVSFAIAAVLSAPYWYTLFSMKQFVNYQWAVTGYYNPRQRLQGLEEVIVLDPRNLKFWHFALAVLGFAVTWKKKRYLFYTAIAYAVLLLLMSRMSFAFWDIGNSVLRYIQFPWRIHSVTATVQLIGIIQLLRYLRWKFRHPHTQRGLVAGLFVIIVLAGHRPFHLLETLQAVAYEVGAQPEEWPLFDDINTLRKVDYYKVIRRQQRDWMSQTGTNEFHPRTMRLDDDMPNRIFEQVPIAFFRNDELGKKGELHFDPESTLHRIRLTARPNQEMTLIINQFYFPGWKVQINGVDMKWNKRLRGPAYIDPQTGRKREDLGAESESQEAAVEQAERQTRERGRKEKDPTAPVARIGANGRIAIDFLKPGEYNVVAYYDGPPGWLVRNLVMLALLVPLMGIIRRRRGIVAHIATRRQNKRGKAHG